MYRWLSLLTACLGLTPLASAQDGKLLYEQNCAACHLPDQMVVGPSMIEITKLYDKKPKEFVAWAVKPLKKRAGVIEMPSMAHLGEANLLVIREYMIKASQGLKEKAPITKDPVARATRRPEVQRMFLPNVGPAAIAVALPGDLNYTFDAGDCRLRTVWRGDFIDCWAYYKSNGKATAAILGKSLWSLTADETLQTRVKFLGYTVDASGLPTFEYRRDGVLFTEKIISTKEGLLRTVTTDGQKEVVLTLAKEETASTGQTVGNVLRLTPAQAKAFTLTLRLL